jgi:CheY-like chemotaxis protein/two-component sensor histidine kinase
MTRGNLLRALAHELRNSIASIVNSVHLIRLRGKDADVAAALAIIDRQVASMTRALEAVVETDRLARGEAQLQSQRIDVRSVIEAALSMKRSLVDSRNQRVRYEPGKHPVWIDADPGRLTQALANVLDNASRYTDEGGDITIDVTPITSEVEIRVRDNGRGIPAETLPDIFEAFASRQSSRAGLGVGLTIARKVCELHGGRITAKSGGEGQGSTFVITLPLPIDHGERTLAPGTPAAAAVPVKVEESPGTRRILVADDNAAVRSSFAAILQEMGHEVRVANDGAEALEVAQQWVPEFVLIDVHMPKVNGYAVARKLRASFPHGVMRLVMMSGTELDQTTLFGAKEAGFDYCIDKTLAVKALDPLLRGEAESLPAWPATP